MKARHSPRAAGSDPAAPEDAHGIVPSSAPVSSPGGGPYVFAAGGHAIADVAGQLAPAARAAVVSLPDVSVVAALGELCDACGVPVPANVDDEGYAVAGKGLYVWTRGTEVRREEGCPSVPRAPRPSVSVRSRVGETDEEEG